MVLMIMLLLLRRGGVLDLDDVGSNGYRGFKAVVVVVVVGCLCCTLVVGRAARDC
jgi:hypothetical protein